MSETISYSKELIAQKLIEWFDKEGRSLPWRDTDNPYFILVSEVMLQQTQVKTVIPYYLRFIETLPTLEALANAKEDTLHTLWEGLGYYSRVKRLQQFAYSVLTYYNGIIPSDKETLLKLPGIGPYTCGAILSFCYHQVEPAMDGNVKRVMARLTGEEGDITKSEVNKRLEALLIELLPINIYSFNQGIIELGALICTPTKPTCERCPVSEFCLGYQHNNLDTIPNKPKKNKQRTVHVPVLIIQRMDEILFVKRETTGLLASLWGLPMVQEDFPVGDTQHKDMIVSLIDYLETTLNLSMYRDYMLQSIYYVGQCQHVFSSIIWQQHIFIIDGTSMVDVLSSIEQPEIKWATRNQVSFPTAFKKTLRYIE